MMIMMLKMMLSLCFATVLTVNMAFTGSRMKSKIGSKNKTPKCPCCGEPQHRGSQLGLVKNTFGGTRSARWVLLECAIEKALSPYVKNPNWSKGQPTSLKYIPAGETPPPPKEEEEELPLPKEEVPMPKGERKPVVPTGEGMGVLAELLVPHMKHLLDSNIEDAVQQLSAIVDDFKDALDLPKATIIKQGIGPMIDVGLAHGKFELVLRKCRTMIYDSRPDVSDYRMNVMLVGPAGTGKTAMAHQLAQALFEADASLGGFKNKDQVKLDSKGRCRATIVSCHGDMMPSDIVGPMVPNVSTGEEHYRRSIATQVYEKGGVLVLDEFDTLPTESAVSLNAALASTEWLLPNGETILRSPDFVCIAICNTFGEGRDNQYNSRNKIDSATLNRFASGYVVIDYCPQIEKKVCPDKTIRETLQEVRNRMQENGVERIISYREMQNCYSEYLMTGDRDAAINGVFVAWAEDDKDVCGIGA